MGCLPMLGAMFAGLILFGWRGALGVLVLGIVLHVVWFAAAPKPPAPK